MSGETIEVDVAVAGGGLVGPALALALARAGLRTAVIDRLPLETRADPGFDGRAYAIALGSARVLGALGLWPALERAAQPIRDIRVCEGPPRQPPAGLHFDPRAIDEGRVGWILEDRHLRGALLAAMAEPPGLAHIGGTAVAGLAAEAGRTRLTLESGATVSASLAVAADGRRSPVAALGGIGYQALAYRQSGLVAAI
ncbi:MAG: FAD-dependent monooxygenase, partial [Pseudomonadota bacterium]